MAAQDSKMEPSPHAVITGKGDYYLQMVVAIQVQMANSITSEVVSTPTAVRFDFTAFQFFPIMSGTHF